VLLAIVTPPRWLAGGIVAMAIVDAALVIGDLLQHPNDALNAAHPAAGLPRLQSAVLGSAVMGYGDLFIAAALGGLLALAVRRPRQSQLAALSAAFAVCFDLLFLLVDELPATVPIALTLIVALAARRRRSVRVARAPTLAASAAHPPPQGARQAPPAPRARAGP
jgi:hypothetical protein